jgi:hypothetical protein
MAVLGMVAGQAWADPGLDHGITLALGGGGAAWTREERSALTRGEVVAKVEGQRLVGARVVMAAQAQVWAAVHDPAVTADPSVVEVRLQADPSGTEVWYGRLSLPSPFVDRQWVVRSAIDLDLARQTGGQVWARLWTEVPDLGPARAALARARLPGTTPDQLDAALRVPKNRGGWMVVALDSGRTLVVATAETDLGGQLPGWIVRDLGRRQVVSLLDRVARLVHQPHPAVVEP